MKIHSPSLRRIVLPLALGVIALAVSRTSVYGTRITASGIGFISGHYRPGNAPGQGENYRVNALGGLFSQSAENDIDASSGIYSVAQGLPFLINYFPIVFERDLFVSKGYFSDYVLVEWDAVNLLNEIERFYIYRNPVGSDEDPILVANLGPDIFSWRDQNAEKTVLYDYTLLATGISEGLRIRYVNTISGSGFSYPTGSATGRVTYEGGTAVEGVSVIAEPTNISLRGSSLEMSGNNSYISLPHPPDDENLELANGFTVQMWLRDQGGEDIRSLLFSKGSDYRLLYDAPLRRMLFEVGDQAVRIPDFIPPVDTFFHVAATYAPGQVPSMRLDVYVNELKHRHDSGSSGPVPAENNETLFFVGKPGSLIADGDASFTGQVDEVRLWNQPLSPQEIGRNFYNYISPDHVNLMVYWRILDSQSASVFDLSRDGNNFHEHHGIVAGGTRSPTVPFNSQLAFRGITDGNGNYTVDGFPYASGGSPYRFVPLFRDHQFEPNEQLRYVGAGASIHNGLNYQDVSSFPISGLVRYRNTQFPVEGVSILIDGLPAVDDQRQIITTDDQGRFTIDVPIGRHGLQLNRSLHTFDSEGRFPPRENPDLELPLYDFQGPLFIPGFVDNTLVTVAGRVVGGPIESGKPLGFGLSNNNIGNATLRLSPEKGFNLTVQPVDSLVTYSQRGVTNTTIYNATQVTVEPNPDTGEFLLRLPPERYSFTSADAGQYIFGFEFLQTLDLTSFVETMEVRSDTVDVKINGVSGEGYPIPFDPQDYLDVLTSVEGTTEYTIATDTFRLDSRKDFVFRTTPTVSVMNDEDGETFGEEVYVYEDEATGEQTSIPLFDDEGFYTFGFPAFLQLKEYAFNVELFEYYDNSDTGESDTVPVSDGRLEITNNFSTSILPVDLELSDRGRAIYRFRAGTPNLSLSDANPSQSFTLPLTVVAFSGNNGSTRTLWRENDPFRGYVFGAIPQGNNFTTTGPNEVFTILRDPPGSNSYAFREALSESTSDTTLDNRNTFSQEAGLKVYLGSTMRVLTGIGVAVSTETTIDNNLAFSGSLSQTYAETGSRSTTLTNTQLWSTSDSQEFVGSEADLFIGSATNLVYGISSFLNPIPEELCENTCNDFYQYGGFRLGSEQGLRVNPEFSTSFFYTQRHIERNVIPGLERLRNNKLVYREPSVTDDELRSPDQAVYRSLVSISDSRFASNNHDGGAWMQQAAANEEEGRNGPSYRILYPDGSDPLDVEVDSISYFNSQIDNWKFWLEENERQKVQAEFVENISYDAGSTIENSYGRGDGEVDSWSFEWSVGVAFSGEVGFLFNRAGLAVNWSLGFENEGSKTRTEETNDVTTFGYVISDMEGAATLDGTAHDFYSIDVKSPEDGFGRSFSTRAGVTSCPYEGGELTRYYMPGESTLHEATIPVEVPGITIENNVATDIPDNRPAEFVVTITNDTTVSDEVFFLLALDEQSNPYGAAVEFEGFPLTREGRQVLVTPGTSQQRVMKVYQGLSDQLEYEGINLILESLCDETIGVEASFSVYFRPACAEISLRSPDPNWVVNTNTVPEETLRVEITDYDLDFENFKKVLFQHREQGTFQWITSNIYYNPRTTTLEEYEEITGLKSWIGGSSIRNDWDMSDLVDQGYEIRAVAACDLGPGNKVDGYSDVVPGVKDATPPRVFGTPQPADGILSQGEDFVVRFDGPIRNNLTAFNFGVFSTLNPDIGDHDVSLRFDGINDYASIPSGLALGSDQSFTIEFWLKRNRASHSSREVVFSKGNGAGTLEFGFNPNNTAYLIYGPREFNTVIQFEDTEGWYHYAVAFDNELGEINMYENDRYILERADVQGVSFSGNGPINLARSYGTGTQYFQGNLHELRIWGSALSIGSVFANLFTSLSGSEVGLLGYWPFNDGFGGIGLDLSRSLNSLVFCDWQIIPEGRGVRIQDQGYLLINTGSSVIIDPTMDYTVELWFKGGPQGDISLFSNGEGDGTDRFNGDLILNIGFDAEGSLFVNSNGQSLVYETGEEEFLDDNWHHLAFALNRVGNASLFVDGELRRTTSSRGFGGLAGVTMLVGARATDLTASSYTPANFFDGIIDEVRIWRLFKTSSLINLQKNNKMSGDEMGLVAYYPFERYESSLGVQVLVPTLEDGWNNPYGPNGGEASLNGGAEISMEGALVANENPTLEIPVDWVINDDELIVIPSSDFETRLEKTIIQITVDGIEDEYDNTIGSPVTWSAYVDRNPVKWSENSIQLEKKLYDPLEFNISIANTGGSEQVFTIQNIPTWLELSNVSGELGPSSNKQLTVTVFRGLNPGYYNVDLYLESDFEFREKLNVKLRVFVEGPEWEVRPEDFDFLMNVIAIVKIEGELSTDIYDRVAVYSGGQIRGLSSVRYVSELDLFQIYLDIYSHSPSGDLMEFRIWDASHAVELRNVVPSIPFDSNRLIGSPTDPLLISSTGDFVQYLSLVSGWNWVSFNTQTDQLSNPNILLEDLSPETGDQIKGQDSFAVYSDFGWSGNYGSSAIDNLGLYKIKISNPGTVTLLGDEVDPGIEIPIGQGWNWLGFLPRFSLTVGESLAGYDASTGDIIKNQRAFSVFEQNLGWVGTLEFLSPGSGYMMRSQGGGSLIYPQVSSIAGRRELAATHYDSPGGPWVESAPLSGDNMTLIAVLGGIQGDDLVLGAFHDSLCRGKATALDFGDTRIYFLTIQGRPGERISFMVYEEGEDTSHVASQFLDYSPDSMIGRLQEPFEIDFSGVAARDGASIHVHPNPFSHNFQVLVRGTSGRPDLRILDVSGKHIGSIPVVPSGVEEWVGFWREQEQGLSLPKGLYFISWQYGKSVTTTKIIRAE